MKVISAFLRENLKYILGFIVIMILVFMIVQWQRADRYYDKYLVSEGDFQSKNRAYIELKKVTDTEKKALARERDEEALARQERNREINRIRAAGRKKDAELVKAKAKIKELTPDQLTTQLNARVPTEFGLLASGGFSLTRNGADRTLGIFMDGERCAGALLEKDSEIEKHKIKEISFNKDRKSFEIDLTLTEGDLERCDKARLAAIKAMEDLHKSFKSMKWKQFGKGAVGGGLAVVVILKIAGVI